MSFWGFNFAKLFPLASQLSYWGVAGSLFLEGLSLPFPGGTFLLLFGVLASQGKISLLLSIVCASLGYTLACTLPFLIGKTGGRRALLNYGPYVGFSNHYFNYTEKWFAKFGAPIVAFGRLLFFRNQISFFAGIAHMPLFRFYLYTWLGITPWVIFMLSLGYFLGDGAMRIISRYKTFGVLIIIATLGLLFWLYKTKIHGKIHNWLGNHLS